jgi:hypothetical protein
VTQLSDVPMPSKDHHSRPVAARRERTIAGHQ